MPETCPHCGAQYLPKAGETECPECASAPDSENWDSIDDEWGDLSDVPTPAPPPLQMAHPPVKPAGSASGGPAAGQTAARKRSRARGKKRAQPNAQPAPAARAKSRKQRPAARAGSDLGAEKKKDKKQTGRPAWLLPLVVLLAAVAVVALALVAARGSG